MKRADPEVLAEAPLDVLVIGGGIYGTMAARDAALRGLRVALVERGDFGASTSHNSLKIMHGGIRYVQHLDFARLRASARERAFWQRAAPGLVRPLDFVIPLFGHGVKGPEAFRAAAAIYNLASAGLRGPDYPGAGVIGAAETRRRMGELAPDDPGLTGGGVWHDGQILDVNRLQLAVLEAAAGAGALLANHMEVEALVPGSGRIVGARVVDRLGGRTAQVRAHVTLLCAGAASGVLAAPHLPSGAAARFPGFARATNIVVDRPADARGIGVVSRSRSDAVVDRGGRMYFFTPWAGMTVIGTHESGPGSADLPERSEPDVDDFLAELSHACPGLGLGRSQVLHAYQGLIPADVDDSRGGGARRHTRGTMADHAQADGLGGLISVVGVKYTTARLIAERAVDRAAEQLDRPVPPSPSFGTPLPEVGLAPCDPDDGRSLAARVQSAVAEEMAVTLEDLLLRRTPLAETGALAGPQGASRLAACAEAMAREMGWSADRTRAEVDAVAARLGVA